jgi:hypothetical protein
MPSKARVLKNSLGFSLEDCLFLDDPISRTIHNLARLLQCPQAAATGGFGRPGLPWEGLGIDRAKPTAP